MKVIYDLNRTKRSSSFVLFFFIVCTIAMVGISPYTSISPVPREAWVNSVIATIPVGDLPAFSLSTQKMAICMLAMKMPIPFP